MERTLLAHWLLHQKGPSDGEALGFKEAPLAVSNAFESERRISEFRIYLLNCNEARLATWGPVIYMGQALHYVLGHFRWERDHGKRRNNNKR